MESEDFECKSAFADLPAAFTGFDGTFCGLDPLTRDSNRAFCERDASHRGIQGTFTAIDVTKSRLDPTFSALEARKSECNHAAREIQKNFRDGDTA